MESKKIPYKKESKAMLLFHLFSAQLLTSRGFKWSSHYCIRKSISVKAQRTHLSFFFFSKIFLHFPSLSLTFFWFLFPKKIKPNRKGNKLSIELTSKRFLKHNKTTTSLRHLSLSLSRKKLLFMFCWERERDRVKREGDNYCSDIGLHMLFLLLKCHDV